MVSLAQCILSQYNTYNIHINKKDKQFHYDRAVTLKNKQINTLEWSADLGWQNARNVLAPPQFLMEIRLMHKK